jgi:hypothetical protein
VRVLQPEGNKRFELNLAAAGCDSVIVMGESHMHDIRRRTLGTLGIKVLSRTDSSFLMVKLANEPSPFACAAHHDDELLPLGVHNDACGAASTPTNASESEPPHLPHGASRKRAARCYPCDELLPQLRTQGGRSEQILSDGMIFFQ